MIVSAHVVSADGATPAVSVVMILGNVGWPLDGDFLFLREFELNTNLGLDFLFIIIWLIYVCILF